MKAYLPLLVTSLFSRIWLQVHFLQLYTRCMYINEILQSTALRESLLLHQIMLLYLLRGISSNKAFVGDPKAELGEGDLKWTISSGEQVLTAYRVPASIQTWAYVWQEADRCSTFSHLSAISAILLISLGEVRLPWNQSELLAETVTDAHTQSLELYQPLDGKLAVTRFKEQIVWCKTQSDTQKACHCSVPDPMVIRRSETHVDFMKHELSEAKLLGSCFRVVRLFCWSCRVGSLDPEMCDRLGVKSNERGFLKEGLNVISETGQIVSPSQVGLHLGRKKSFLVSEAPSPLRCSQVSLRLTKPVPSPLVPPSKTALCLKAFLKDSDYLSQNAQFIMPQPQNCNSTSNFDIATKHSPLEQQ